MTYEDNPIILSVNHPKFIQREAWLRKMAQKAIEQPFISFSAVVSKYRMGIYLIYDDNELLYVGMTERHGHNRLREILSGFSKHTFNRKLVEQFLRKQDYPIGILSAKNYKRDLIDTNILTGEILGRVQKEVNDYIRSKLRYQFFEFEYHQIREMEHYLIATLQPLYND